MELSELSQSHLYELDALGVGLLACAIVGFCILVGYLFHLALDRSPRFDERSPARPPRLAPPLRGFRSFLLIPLSLSPREEGAKP